MVTTQNGRHYKTCRVSVDNLQYMDGISNKRSYDEIISLLITNYKTCSSQAAKKLTDLRKSKR